MNGQPCASTGRAQSWESINWTVARAYVRKLQMRIVKAQKEGRFGKVKSLQWLLTHSFYAKALAVKRVTENTGKRTSGIDRELWNTPQTKYKAIAKMYRRGYQPAPTRRIYIPKKNGKLRPLSIPTMLDRAMQTLYRFSLEPIAETVADPNSYGFRIGRGTHDAIDQCYKVLRRGVSPQWVLEGDIKSCFDRISHEWLLENVPMDTEMLRKWLKCGFVESQERFPTEEGTPQGGSISSTLMNLTLDGLERHIHGMLPEKRNNEGAWANKINFIRYADDFIITGTSPELLRDKVLPLVRAFLRERGLELSEEKTLITHIDEGFDFLGKNIRRYNGKLLIKPSKSSIKSFLDKVRRIINGNAAMEQGKLIHKLNPVIRGWVNNQRFVSSADVFGRVDYEIYKCLWRWACRRHHSKGKRWVAEKYWHRVGNRNWTFSVKSPAEKDGSRVYYPVLEYATDTKYRLYIKVRAEANPFDETWAGYFEEREGEKMLHSLKGRDALLKLWRSQKGRCPVCGEKLNSETGFKMHKNAITGGVLSKTMVHKECHRVLHSGSPDYESVLLTEDFEEA